MYMHVYLLYNLLLYDIIYKLHTNITCIVCMLPTLILYHAFVLAYVSILSALVQMQ